MDEDRKRRDEEAIAAAEQARRAEARTAVERIARKLDEALSAPTPLERYAAVDALWTASPLLERKAMRELMMAMIAGFTIGDAPAIQPPPAPPAVARAA